MPLWDTVSNSEQNTVEIAKEQTGLYLKEKHKTLKFRTDNKLLMPPDTLQRNYIANYTLCTVAMQKFLLQIKKMDLITVDS